MNPFHPLLTYRLFLGKLESNLAGQWSINKSVLRAGLVAISFTLTYYKPVSKSQFYTFLFFIVPLAYFMSLPISVGDLTVWVAQGLKTLENGSLFLKDTFSVLNTKEQIYPVGITLIYAGIDFLGGLYLIAIFHKIIWLFILYIIYQNSLAKLHNPFNLKNLAFILIFYSASSLFLIDRPAFIALLFLLLSYLVIEKNDEINFTSIFQLSIIHMIWVNIHGSWPLILIMYSWKYLFFLNTKNFTKRFAGGCALLASAAINPFGFNVYSYVLETMAVSKSREIDEWNLFNLIDYFPHGYIFILSFLTIGILVLRRVLITKEIKILSSPIWPLFFLGITAIRNVGLFSIVLLPFLFKYHLLSEGPPKIENSEVIKFKKLINLGFAIVLMLITLGFTPWGKDYLRQKYGADKIKKLQTFDESAPQSFTNYIKASNNLNPIMNDWDYGSFLMYEVKNQHLIDTRNIIYSQEDFIKYIKVVYEAQDWQNYVDQYQFAFAILKKKQSHKLITEMQSSNQWKFVLENQESVLLEKTY